MQKLEGSKLPKEKKSIVEKIIIILGCSIFFLSIVAFYIAGKIRTADIENNKGFTTGQITNCKRVGGRSSGWSLEYSYIVDGVLYENFNSGRNIRKNNCEFFMGKYFPVIYSTKNPKRSGILMDPYAFEAWGLTFPDSLSWTEGLWGF